MFDAFPFDEWSEDIAEFWTFGGEGSTGTWIMTVVGFSVMLIAFAQNQLFLCQAVDDAGQVAHRHHHFRANFSEWKAAGIADGREHVKLRWSKTLLFQISFQLFVRLQIEAQKAYP